MQYWLVVVDVKKNPFKHMKMKWNMQWRIWKIKEKKQGENLRTSLNKSHKFLALELINTEARNLWDLFKDEVL